MVQFEINLRQYRDSLRNLGMGEAQVEEMIRTRQYVENVEITSPADGVVLQRVVSAGQRFEKGTELFQIADLRHVWVFADLFEDDAPPIPAGTAAVVTTHRGKRDLPARVSAAVPRFDPAARTLQLRLEVDNPGLVLFPGMFVEVDLPVPLSESLTVPVDAVIDTGLRSLVYVDRGGGIFEPRKVTTGWRLANRVQILGGLAEGERVAVAGNFLLDSESRLRVAAAGVGGHPAVDPSCGHLCDAGRALAEGNVVTREGRTWYFCSPECKAEFGPAAASPPGRSLPR